jgi:predicted kinase
MCGLPGSGKTTLARRLERDEPALRLCPDEWMMRIVGDGYAYEERAAVDAIQFELAIQALSLGLNVVLESGFWKRADRDRARAEAARVGARCRLHVLVAPLEELKARISARNRALPANTFHIDADDIDLWATWFEPPGVDELAMFD